MYVTELQTIERKLACACFCERILQLSGNATMFSVTDQPSLNVQTLHKKYP